MLYISRTINPVNPPHSRDLDRWDGLALSAFQQSMRKQPGVLDIRTVSTVETLALCSAHDNDDGTTAYEAYIIYGDVHLDLQMHIVGAFNEAEYEAFQSMVASVAFTEDSSAGASYGSLQPWMRKFKMELVARGLEGVRYQYDGGSVFEDGDCVENYDLYYGAYEAHIMASGRPDGTAGMLSVDFPCGLSYQDADDLRVFDDLRVIQSACALMGRVSGDAPAELALQIYRQIMDEMNGAPKADSIVRNGHTYIGGYSPDSGEALMIILANGSKTD